MAGLKYSRHHVAQLHGVWFAREVLRSLRDPRFHWDGVKVLPRERVCPMNWDDGHKAAAARACTRFEDLPTKCARLFPNATTVSFWTATWNPASVG